MNAQTHTGITTHLAWAGCSRGGQPRPRQFHPPILYSQGRSLGSSKMLSLRFFLQQRAGYV